METLRNICFIVGCALVFVVPSFVSAKTILLPVPFTSQAPTGRWSDPDFQNGCEEASILMAYAWAAHTPLSPEVAVKKIKAITAFERKLIGDVFDTSAADTARLMKAYFKYSAVSVKHNISAKDIVVELSRGNLVIVPANGRALGNPNFRAPGPLTHMLVVRGYDDRTREFIVNDPGTRRGNGYRYSRSVLEGAIRDYPTGNHIKNVQKKTAMIVVRLK
ncbi:MAG: C39 family peptidase [bacterium]|nr:C39 family peptidase [bacterium]